MHHFKASEPSIELNNIHFLLKCITKGHQENSKDLKEY